MNNSTILIDSYLQNEMSTEEKAAFELQLSTDKNFQEEFEIQKQIINAAETAGLKNEFAKAIRKRIVTRRLIRGGIVLIIAAIAFIFYAIKTDLFHYRNSEEKVFQPIERFDINNSRDTIIETRDGVVFAIPAHAFGETNSIQLEIKTALNAYEIMQNGLSTMADNNLLQTAGMFSINGFSNGKPASLVKEIAVSVPAQNINPAMQLFDGVEDSSGRVNWVNPRPVVKGLRTFDISTLDFYPPKYIPTLKALQKDHRNKKYTDSLYYSFSGYPHSRTPANTNETIYADAMSREWTEGVDTTKYPDIYFGSDSSKSWDHAVDSAYSHDYERIYQIDPSNIRAIWNKQFNNTIIATKEFEERVNYMHSLCDPGYLEAYLSNLNKPLYQTDQLIADNSSGAIKTKFLEFAARKDGGVMIANGLQEKLTKYFQQRSKAYKEAVAKTWEKYQAELQRLNKVAETKNREQELQDFMRSETNFKEELCINLSEAYKQIGIKRNCPDTVIVPPPTKYYNVTITTTGWKNLDVYVFDATQNRQSMTYTDPNTGRIAKLIYQEVNIKIQDEEKFDRVLVYLIPDSLSSFQLVQKKENSFKENLNSLFKYDAVVLAYKGTQAYFFRQAGLQPQAYIFSLSAITEKALSAELKVYSINKTKELRSEFEYRLFEQEEAMRQIKLRKDQLFREQVAASIFNCIGEYYSFWPEKDSATKK